MKSAKEILDEVVAVVKMAFSADQQPVIEPTEPVTMKLDLPLKDGSTLVVDKMEVGGMAWLNEQPAEGEYVTNDGKKIEVKAGNITAIETVSDIVEPQAMGDMPKKVEEMQAKFSAVEKSYEAKFKLQEKQITALKSSVEQLITVVEMFSEQSARPPKETVNPAELTPVQKFRLSKQK